MKEILVNVSKPYKVLISEDIIQSVPDLVSPICRSKRVAIITDDIVDALYGTYIQNLLQDAGYEAYKYVFPNGEKSKNLSTLSSILEFLAVNKIRRNDTLIAVGGGVVGDIAGFAAAVHMRGINVIQIPTTLLAMVDSSVGGKTAVDLENGKNLAGAFWQPAMVICDTTIAKGLPSTIFSEGMAEVIKCNVIKELPIIDYIEKKMLYEHLPSVIESCIELKRDIVEKDEFDIEGIRNILNVGHTIAHAIEKLSGYGISHGTAVGYGIYMEAQIANKMGLCDQKMVSRIEYAVKEYNLVCNIPWSGRTIAEAMKADKKNRDSDIVFELPSRIVECHEYKLSINEISSLIEVIQKM